MKSFWLKSIMITICVLGSQSAMSATMALSLDLSVNPGGGGTWILRAASDEHGIAGLRVLLQDVATVTLQAPRATVNGGASAGFNIFYTSVHPAYTEVVIGQAPLAASQVVAPNKQNIFYGVGSISNGVPTSSGLTYYNLSNLQGSPWGTGLGGGPLSKAAVLLSGTFVAGQYPRFFNQGTNTSVGNVFTSLGTTTTMGTTAIATEIKMWQGVPGDGDLDGDIDADDYQVWRSNFGGTNPLADFNRDGIANAADYTVWRDNLGFNVNN